MKYSSDMLQADSAFKKALKSSKFYFLDRKTEKIKEFNNIRKNLTNKIYLGEREVPLSKIVGTVAKAQDFDINFNPLREGSKDRWTSIYRSYLGNGSLPPLILYKVGDEYYVYDGNHRVSVAKNLNFHSIEAEVYEFFSTSEEELNALSMEKFSFEKETGLKNIICSKTDNYKILREDIQTFSNLYSLGGYNYDTFATWYYRIFIPTVNILLSNFKKFENENNGDIFVKFLKYRSKFELEHQHQESYTYPLVDYLNRKKIDLTETLETDINLDSFLIDDFRKLYYIDKFIFYTDNTKDKIKAIRDFTKKIFKRESLIIGEIYLYGLENNSSDFIFNMQTWFREVFDFYKQQILKKSSQLNINFKDIDLDELAEDCIRYSRYYRKKSNTLLTKKELVFSYLLDIYLPIFFMFHENGIEKDLENQYMKISQSYLYYSRYGGKDNLKDFMETNILNKEGYKIGNFILSENITLEYNLNNKLANYTILKNYGGTQNYKTVHKLKEYVKSLNLKTYKDKNLKFKNDIEELIKNREVLIQYNNSRILNLIRGKWEHYTFVDYYANLL